MHQFDFGCGSAPDRAGGVYAVLLAGFKAAYTHTRLRALFRDYPGEPVPER